MNAAGGMLTLTDGSRIVATDPTLEPLAKVLSDDVYRVADLRLATTTDKPKAGDIVLSLDKSLKDETYKLDINDIATIHGGNYRAVVWGTSTLLQALNADGKSVQLPKMAVKDSPDTEFRSVMLDLARRWHPIGTVKETIVLLQLYKIPYLHLHLSDNESCVYTSKAFPKLSSSRRSYSIE
jgi:hexosaminidase